MVAVLCLVKPNSAVKISKVVQTDEASHIWVLAAHPHHMISSMTSGGMALTLVFPSVDPRLLISDGGSDSIFVSGVALSGGRIGFAWREYHHVSRTMCVVENGRRNGDPSESNRIESNRIGDFEVRLVFVRWSKEGLEDSLASLPGLVSHCTLPSRRTEIHRRTRLTKTSLTLPRICLLFFPFTQIGSQGFRSSSRKLCFL